MKKIIPQKELDELINTYGRIRGVGMKSYGQFIEKEEGKEGLESLEQLIREAGYQFKFKDVKPLKFYPLGLLGVILVGIKRLFGYNDEKFQEMGTFHVKSSFLIRMFGKYFFSLERILKEIPKIWRRHLSIGFMEVAEYNEKEKRIIIRLKDYSFHPLHCEILKGYFEGAFQMALKIEGVCREPKCTFRGDDYHEFLIEW